MFTTKKTTTTTTKVYKEPKEPMEKTRESCGTCKYYDYLAKQRKRFGVCRMMTYNASEKVQVIPGDASVIVRDDHHCSMYEDSPEYAP